MRENKLITTVIIVTIVSILLVFGGITYAYFTAFNSEGSTAEITVGPGKMIITYNDGTDNLVPVTDIQPSDKILVNKTFSLTGTNTATGVTSSDGLNMPYKVGLKYTSTFSDGQIHYYIKEVNRPSSSNVTVEYTGTTNQTVQGNSTYTGYSHGTLNKGNDKYTEMATGEFPSSTSDQTITFNLILQFPDTGENQDSEKGATINGKIEINYEKKPTTFAADSWSDIATFVSKNKIETYTVGSEKEIEIDGISYTVRIANNTTPEECNGTNFSQTACGFVVEFVDIVETRKMNSTSTNVGGWSASDMRTYANGDFFNKLPSDLQNAIIDTKVITGHGNTSGETNFTSTDKIYLLSGHEILKNGTQTSRQISFSDTAYNYTRQLDYYANLGVTTDNYSDTIKQYNSSNSNWWLRTAVSAFSNSFLIVGKTGDWAGLDASKDTGFAPAFRIG